MGVGSFSVRGFECNSGVAGPLVVVTSGVSCCVCGSAARYWGPCLAGGGQGDQRGSMYGSLGLSIKTTYYILDGLSIPI